jgi:hypothetical protein
VLERPQADEYAAYYGNYIAQAPDGDILQFLEKQIAEARTLLAPLSEKQGDHRYAAGKWSLKEVVGHISDTERVFCVRALAFARQDPSDLPGFDQDIYVANGFYDSRTVQNCLQEFEAVRAATLALFRSLDDRALQRQGRANNVVFSVRSVAWIVGGHARHHLGVLRERCAI